MSGASGPLERVLPLSSHRREGLLPHPTDRLALTTGGLRVSPFCLGLVDDWRSVLEAYDAGINFFFVSTDMHWPLYEASRKGLRDLLRRGGGIRDDVVLVGACYVTQPEFCWSPFIELCDALPEALGIVDVLLAGGMYAGDLGARARTYQQHRTDQFCGAEAIGATFHDRTAAAVAYGNRLFDIVMIRYNPIHLGAIRDVFPLAEEVGDHPLLFNFNCTHGLWELPTIEGDYWMPEIADGYRFALSRSAVDGILLSVVEDSTVDSFLEAIGRGALTAEEQEHMVALAMQVPVP